MLDVSEPALAPEPDRYRSVEKADRIGGLVLASAPGKMFERSC